MAGDLSEGADQRKAIAALWQQLYLTSDRGEKSMKSVWRCGIRTPLTCR
jgi:hypothetical protein